jgi:hypothetical protein
MTNYTDVLMPTSSPGTMDNSGSGGSSQISETESAQSTNVMAYIFVLWSILLLLIAALICLVMVQRCKRKEQLEQQADVENIEQPTTTSANSYGERISERVGLAAMIIATSVALVVATYSIITCDFLDLDYSLQLDVRLKHSSHIPDAVTSVTIYGIGLWSLALKSATGGVLGDSSQCFDTSGLFLLDWQFIFARASAVIANLIGGLCLPVLVACCLEPKFRSYIHHLVWPFLIAAFFQLMTLVLFESMYCSLDFNMSGEANNNCRVSIGATASITAALFWIYGACAAALLRFGRAKPMASPSLPEVHVVDAQ